MKQKFIQMKRRWRKLDKSDRWMYIAWGIIAVLNIPLVCMGSMSSLTTILWVFLLVFVKASEYALGRKRTRRMFIVGKFRVALVLEECAMKLFRRHSEYMDLQAEHDELKQKYNKLECDYHRLKKQAKRNGKTNR